MNNFFRKAIAFTLVFVIAFVMSACSSKQKEPNVSEEDYIQDNESDSSNNSQDSNGEQNVTKDGLAMENCSYCSDYDGGFAWNIYSLYPAEYSFRTSVIDKTGRMLFSWDSGLIAYEGEILPGFSCDNEYVYIEKNGKFYVIDSSGKVLYSCAADSDNAILAYGEGYIITRNYQASFDSSSYTYIVYAPNGSVISQKETDYVLDTAYYLGHGIFGYYLDKETNCHFFNAKSNTSSETKMEAPILENASFARNNSIVYIGYDGNWNDGNSYFTYRFLNESGEIISVDLKPEDGTTERVMVSGEKCMIQTEANLYVFDSSNKELKTITLPYEDKVMWGEAFAFGENKIVVPLQGDDSQKYIIVIDNNGELLLEPTLARQYTRFSDNRMVLTTEDDICVYDEEMNVAYSLSQLDFIDLDLLHTPINRDIYSLGEYSDGVTILTEWGGDKHDKYLYLDIDGNLLFEEIDTSEALDLNSEIEK